MKDIAVRLIKIWLIYRNQGCLVKILSATIRCMVKYVLNSGGLRDKPDLAKKFFGEVVRGLGERPRLLICCFAQPREDWEKKFVEDQANIPKLVPEGIEPTLELAFPATFEQQIKDSDAMYIHGGDDHLIRYWLERFDIPRIWDGKTVATNSGSSNALSASFWTCDWRKCMDGLGILPVKFVSHFRSSYGTDDPRGPIDWDRAYQELKERGNNPLPIHALEEGCFVVIEK